VTAILAGCHERLLSAAPNPHPGRPVTLARCVSSPRPPRISAATRSGYPTTSLFPNASAHRIDTVWTVGFRQPPPAASRAMPAAFRRAGPPDGL